MDMEQRAELYRRLNAPPGSLDHEIETIIRELCEDPEDPRELTAAVARLAEWYTDAPGLLQAVSLPDLALSYQRPRLWVTLLWAHQHALDAEFAATLDLTGAECADFEGGRT